MYSTNTYQNNQIKHWLILLIGLVILIILVGGLTRLTDSGLSITTWELFIGFFPPLTHEKWLNYFDLYKKIPEYTEQNFNMSLSEFKFIFWWEWGHRQLGRLIGLTVLIPMIYFTMKRGFVVIKEYGIIFLLVCFQGFIGWYMVSSGLIDRVDVSHYRLSIHLFTAFLILSIIFWKYLKIIDIEISHTKVKPYLIKFFLFLLFLQLIIGAFVSGMDAGKVYSSWPLMGSSYFPDDSKLSDLFRLSLFNDPSLTQFIHRNLAYVIAIFYIYFLLKTFLFKQRKIYLPILILGISLLLQIILGILTLFSGVKILYASLHQINSVIIILSTIYLLYISNYKEKIS